MQTGKIVSTVVLAIIAGGTLACAGKLWENVPASDYVVIQSPVAGDLTWYTSQGLKWQGFGDVTAYNIRMKYDFREKGRAVQFNDGGHGTIFGSIQCDLPADHEVLTEMHRKFPSQDQVESSLVKTATEGAIYLTGTLMSSRESYAEKKNDLIHYITDQVQNGPYKTRQRREWVKDPITNESKEVVSAEIVLNKDGSAERQEQAALSRYKITCYQFTIDRIAYDPAIEAQVRQQQAITMNVQTSVADKVLAEQRAQTAEASGRANATEAKWRQETIKATEMTRADQERQVAIINADRERQVQMTNASRDKEVADTQATQRLSVAELDRKSAEQKKAELTFLGEGEAARKKLVLDADGALEQKLSTYERVAEKWANALKGSELVPRIVFGGGAQQGGSNPVIDLVTMLNAKAAQDLSLNLGVMNQPQGVKR